MSRRLPHVGDVIQIALPDETFAYGRVLNDAAVGFYRQRSRKPHAPPIGSRDYEFIVGVHDEVFRSSTVRVVARDPDRTPEDHWPPPQSVRDPITGRFKIYDHGILRPAKDQEAEGLEPAAIWSLDHLLARLCEGKDLSYWQAARQ